MVVKILTLGTGGDLNNATDLFGAQNDKIYVLNEITERTYAISTYQGRDLIDLRDANAGNIHAVYAGSGNDTIFGGDATDRVFDQSGNDLITLGRGDDTLFAGTGNDTVTGGSGRDMITFYSLYSDLGSGDVNATGITCDLRITTAQNFRIFGTDRISGFEDVQGGNGNDRLSGTKGSNLLDANAGNDVLAGRGGQDFLFGGAGADILAGGAGGDNISTGSGDGAGDIIRYSRITDSGTGLAEGFADRITGFETGGLITDDRIDLSRIDARPSTAVNDAFIFRGTGNFTSARGEVRVELTALGMLVMVDTDGDPLSEMDIILQGVTSMTAADFIL